MSDLESEGGEAQALEIIRRANQRDATQHEIKDLVPKETKGIRLLLDEARSCNPDELFLPRALRRGVAEATQVVSEVGATSTGSSNLEVAEIDSRLMPLVVNPIKTKYPDGVEIQGKVRTAEEIARAIPDVEAFLIEVNLQKKDGIFLDFFELNESGQLVMKDDCKEAYGLGENALEARIRQTRVVYKEGGQTEVMTGRDYFKVTKTDGEGRPLHMELSEKAKKISPETILMARGLPTLTCDSDTHTGEYARMNIGQLEIQRITWTDDKMLVTNTGSPDFSRARYAYWYDDIETVLSRVRNSYFRDANLGSRGVLRVNLNFDS